jgi:magnesium transporter
MDRSIELSSLMLPFAVRDKLRLLLQYSRKLAVFQKRATLVQECLEEVLENGAFEALAL